MLCTARRIGLRIKVKNRPLSQRFALGEVKRFARVFRDSGYQIKPLLFSMLTSDAFYAPENRAALIKSPVELLVGTLKQFDVHADDLRPVAVASAALGQNLFSPPNVKGWPGGDAWINSTTLLGRKQFLDRLFRENGEFIDVAAPAMGDGRDKRMLQRLSGGLNAISFDAGRWATTAPASSNDVIRLVLATQPEQIPLTQIPLAAKTGRALVRSLVLDPAYQLK